MAPGVAGIPGLTVTALEVAGLPVAHVELEVNTTVTTSLEAGV
jgi:hypothetical protein